MSKWDVVEVLAPSFFSSIVGATWDADNDLVIPGSTTATFIFAQPVKNYQELQFVLETPGGNSFPRIQLLYDSDDAAQQITWINNCSTGLNTANKFPYVGELEGFTLTTPSIGVKIKNIRFVPQLEQIVQTINTVKANATVGAGWVYDPSTNTYTKSLTVGEAIGLPFTVGVGEYCFVRMDLQPFGSYDRAILQYRGNFVNIGVSAFEAYLDSTDATPGSLQFLLNPGQVATVSVKVLFATWNTPATAFGVPGAIEAGTPGSSSTIQIFGSAAYAQVTDFLARLSNFADVLNKPLARTNLGLGTFATVDIVGATLVGISSISATSITATTNLNISTVGLYGLVDILDQRNGLFGQAWRLYNTYTDASNYERVAFIWSGSNFAIDMQSSGTGVTRNIRFNRAGLTWLTYDGTNIGLGDLQTGQRIRLNTNQIPRINRTLFQETTANNGINFGIIPNGTGNSGTYSAFNASDADNSSCGQLQTTTVAVILNSTKFGTGVQLPIKFQLAAVDAGIIDLNKNYTSLASIYATAGRVISVEAYAAVGDYVPTTGVGTDNRGFFQAALNAAYAAGGGTVTYDNKRYKIAGVLVIPPGVTLRGPHSKVQSGWRGAVGFPGVVADPATNGGIAMRNIGGSLWITFDVGRGNQTVPNAANPTTASDWTQAATAAITATITVTNTITASAGTPFSIFIAGQKISMTGWVNGVNNVLALTIVTVTGGGSGMTFTGAPFINEGPRAGVVVKDGTYDVFDMAGLPNFATRTAAIYCGGTIEGCYIFSASYTNPIGGLGYTDGTNFNSGIATTPNVFAGLAIRQYGEDACVRNCFIGGFMQAILSYNEARGVFEDLLLDCLNGIEVSSSFDVCTIRRVHAYPFGAEGFNVGSTVRRGTFIWMHDTTDWARIESCFTFGHKVGFRLNNINAIQLNDCGADNINSAGEFTGYVGLYVMNACQHVVVSNFKAANRENGILVDAGVGNAVSTVNATMAGCGTGINVITGNCTASGGYFLAGANGVKVGITNSGAGTIKAVNPTFSGMTSNTTNTGGGVLTLL